MSVMLLQPLNPPGIFARLATPAKRQPPAPQQQRQGRRAPPIRRLPEKQQLRKTHRKSQQAPSPSDPSSPSSSTALQCQHFQSCSGCSREFNLDRPQLVDEAAIFFKERGVADFTFHSGDVLEWRCRAKLAVRGTSAAPSIGLYEEGTHNVVDIPLCRAHHPSINAMVNLLRKGITILNIEPYNEEEGTGELRYVQMSVTTHDTSVPSAERYKKGKVQVALVWNSRNENSPSSEKLLCLARFIWRNGGPNSEMHLVHSIWANFQTSTSNVIFGNNWKHLLGERDFWEHLGGVDICLSPSTFAQANTQAFDSLLKKLQKHVPHGSAVVDLYAGAGVIGLSVAKTRRCRSVKCVEVNKEAKISFEKSLDRLPSTVEGSISWHHADVSADSLHWIKGSDVVIVDPPRKGLDSSLVDLLTRLKSISANESSLLTKEKDEKRPWILRSREASVQLGNDKNSVKTQESDENSIQSELWPRTLIYISCGWDSFKEDCRALLSSRSWHLEKAYAFNFFPGTQSIEVLAVFKRGPKPGAKKKKAGKKKARKGK